MNPMVEIMQILLSGSEDKAISLLKTYSEINMNEDILTDSIGIQLCPLQWACRHGARNFAQCLIDKGADVNIKDYMGSTCIHISALYNTPDVLSVLLKTNIPINAVNNKKQTALMFSCGVGSIQVTRLLIENGADLNSVDMDGKTPLHHAIQGEHLEIIQYLIEKGINLNNKDSNLITPLHVACFLGSNNVVKLLLNNGANLSCTGVRAETPLFAAVYSNNPQLVNYLIDKGAKINVLNVYGQTPLHVSCLEDKYKILQVLIHRGSKSDQLVRDYQGNTLLHGAVQSDNETIVKLLLDNGALPEISNSFLWTPLHFAVYLKKINVLRYLISRGCSIDTYDCEGETPITTSIKMDNIDILKMIVLSCESRETSNAIIEATRLNSERAVRVILQCRPNVVNYSVKDVQDMSTDSLQITKAPTGYTALHVASQNGFVEIVKILLEKGADVGMKDAKGSTPLHHAAFANKLEVARILLDKGADVNVKNNRGATAIKLATEKRFEMMKTILEESQQESSKCTLLHIAIKGKDTHKIQNLLDQGCSPTTTNDQGFNALHYATICGNKNAAQILLNRFPNFVNLVQEDATSIGQNQGASNDPTSTFKGYTALHIACQKGHKDIVKILLEKGADVGMKDAKGSTPLHHAAFANKLEVSRILLDKGADVNVKNNRGATAQQIAVEKGWKEMENILKFGVDKTGRTAQGDVMKPEPAGDLLTLKQKMEQMTLQLQKQSEVIDCPICYAERRNTIFQCGHTFCASCARRCTDCPNCRVKIKQRTKMFLT